MRFTDVKGGWKLAPLSQLKVESQPRRHGQTSKELTQL